MTRTARTLTVYTNPAPVRTRPTGAAARETLAMVTPPDLRILGRRDGVTSVTTLATIIHGPGAHPDDPIRHALARSMGPVALSSGCRSYEDCGAA